MKRWLLVSAAVAFMLLESSALAQLNLVTGTIRVLHVNSEVLGRGPCIQTNPPAPGVGGWLCLWRTNPLYPELSTLLRDVFGTQQVCSFGWNQTDPDGLGLLEYIDCTAP